MRRAILAATLLAPGCGGQHTTDDAAWVGIVAGAFAVALFIGGAIGWRMHRREGACDPEMPEVQL